MKPRDWFGVGVRLFGVWMLVSAAEELVLLANVLLGYTKASNGVGLYVVHAGGDVLVALALFTAVTPLTTLVGPWGTTDGTNDGRSRCPTCGYDLRATPGHCPECGWAADGGENAGAGG